MNLLVLGSYGETTSGPSRVLMEVISRFSENMNIFVLSPKKRRESYRVDKDLKNIKIRFQPCGQLPKIPGSHQWIEIIRINRRLNSLDFKPDLIWIHSAPLFLAYRFSKFRNIPAVSTVHGVFGRFYEAEATERIGSYFSPLFFTQNLLLQKYEFEKTYHITTYSDYLKNQIRSISPSSNVTVIPNGVNTSQFKEYRGDRKKIILYIGRMAKIKGVHVLIESMKWILKDHPNWSLWLVGGAFDQPKSFFEKYMNPVTAKQIRFLGQIPNTDLPSILNDAGIFVMPTLRDGFEIALMEAMASGIPCITTSAYERIGLYGGYAELVPTNNPKALGDKIRFVIENMINYTGSSAVQKRVNRAKEFDWKQIASLYEKFFKEIIEWKK